jgi:hypothetical protein
MRVERLLSVAIACLFASGPAAAQSPADAAELQAATTLASMRLNRGALRVYSTIAQRPAHAGFAAALGGIAQLSDTLPDGNELVDALALYDDAAVRRLDASPQRGLVPVALLAVGRQRYRAGRYDEAARFLGGVTPSARQYVPAQMLSGAAFVRLQRSVNAVQSFQRALRRLEEGSPDVPSPDRMRELANVSIARIFLSAAVRLDENDAPTIDQTKLSAAAKFYAAVDPGSEYWIDAVYEQAWLHFLAGSYVRASAYAQTLRSAAFSSRHALEARMIEGVIAFALCTYDEAAAHFDWVRREAQATRDDLARTSAALASDLDAVRLVWRARNQPASIAERARPAASRMLSDRAIVRALAATYDVEDEARRFAAAPPAMRASELGRVESLAIDAARAETTRRAARLVREHLQAELAIADGALADASRGLWAVQEARMNRLDPALAAGAVSQQEAVMLGKPPRTPPVRFPFHPSSYFVVWELEPWLRQTGSPHAMGSRCGR